MLQVREQKGSELVRVTATPDQDSLLVMRIWVPESFYVEQQAAQWKHRRKVHRLFFPSVRCVTRHEPSPPPTCLRLILCTFSPDSCAQDTFPNSQRPSRVYTAVETRSVKHTAGDHRASLSGLLTGSSLLDQWELTRSL